MKAYASLHTSKPTNQTDFEVSYEGYERVEIDFHPNLGNPPVDIIFPMVQADSSEEVNHIMIGGAKTGDGEIGLVIHTMPYQELPQTYKPKVTITNVVADKNGDAVGNGISHEVHILARTIYYLVMAGEMKSEEIHPKLYEAVNEELAKHNVPVIPVARAGAAKMVQCSGWTLEDLGAAVTEH